MGGGYGHGGGAHTIQVLLIKYLTSIGEKCKLFDVKNGSVSNELISRNVEFDLILMDRPHSKKDYSNYLSSEDLLIVFDTNLWGNLYSLGKSSCKILIWEIYYPWVKRFINYRFLPSKCLVNFFEIKILNEIVNKNGFFFINYMGKELAEKRSNTKISDEFYLPIPIIIPKDNIKEENIKSKSHHKKIKSNTICFI